MPKQLRYSLASTKFSGDVLAASTQTDTSGRWGRVPSWSRGSTSGVDTYGRHGRNLCVVRSTVRRIQLKLSERGVGLQAETDLSVTTVHTVEVTVVVALLPKCRPILHSKVEPACC
jgi:hypothetical protein